MIRFSTTRRHRRTLASILCAAIISAGVIVWCLWPHTKAQPKIIANNVSGRPMICLAADSATAAKSDTVASAWTAIQHAGTATGSNAQQLIEPASDPARTQALLAGLVSHHCKLVVTVGPAFAQAIGPVGRNNPEVKFAAVDSALTDAPANTSLLPSTNPTGSDLTTHIETLVSQISAQPSSTR